MSYFVLKVGFFYPRDYIKELIVQEYNSSDQPTLGFLYDENENLLETLKYEYDCNLIQVIDNDIFDALFMDCESSCFLKKAIETFEEDRSVEITSIQYNERVLTKGYYSTAINGETTSRLEFEYQCD